MQGAGRVNRQFVLHLSALQNSRFSAFKIVQLELPLLLFDLLNERLRILTFDITLNKPLPKVGTRTFFLVKVNNLAKNKKIKTLFQS